MRTLRHLVRAVLCGTLLSAAVFAAEEPRRNYDIPAADAAAALKQFSATSGRETLFASEAVRGVRTPAVKGELTTQEALDALLAGTGLIATVDEKTGAIAVRRETPIESKNGPSRRADREAADLRQSRSSVRVENGAVRLEQYEVSASRETGVVNQGVIPREENGAVRYTVISRADLERSGATSLSEFFVRQVSQSANYGTGTQQTFGAQLGLLNGIETPGDYINLRGLGSGQTLVMINGRRLYGGAGGGPDISRIPLSAIERIEISPSSGSAIYGANAVAGVVNFVLRRNYAGKELTAYIGAARGGAEEGRLSYYQGFNFNDGKDNLTINAEYKHVNALSLGDRNFQAKALERIPLTNPPTNLFLNEIVQNFTGPRGVVYGLISTGLGIPGNPTARYATVPAGTTAAGLTPASFSSTAGAVEVSNSRLDQVNLVGPLESASIYAVLEHAFNGDRFAAYTELSYRWANNGAGEFVDYVPQYLLLPGAPFNPFTVPAVMFLDSTDVPRPNQTSVQRTMRAVAGLKGKFSLWGGRDFNWSVDASWDRDQNDTHTTRYAPLLAIAAVNGLYNPVRDLTNAPQLPAAQLDHLRSGSVNHSHPEITATNWRANGDLFDWWGGTAALSLGAEYRYEYQYFTSRNFYGDYINLPAAFGISPPMQQEDFRNRSYRSSYAGFFEATLPLVSAKNNVPLVRSLTASLAMRYEKYDDFRAAHPPMVALKWEPVPDFSLRAQYSEGFQPPTQDQLSNPGFLFGPTTFVTYTDPARPGLPLQPVYVLSGAGNPNLKPETSDTWDVGVIFTPRFLPGFTANVAYFRYDKHDLAGFLSEQDYVDAGFIVRGPNVPGDPAGVPGPIVQINTPVVNIARQFTDGYDLKLDYRWDTASAGTFFLHGQATLTKSFYRQDSPTTPLVDTLAQMDRGGETPLKRRGNLGLAWERDRWAASWNTRYYDSYSTDSNTPNDVYPNRSGLDGPEIGSTVEHDVQFSYRFPSAESIGWRNWVSGTKFTIGVLNVFDRDPPYISDRGQLWYSYFSDPRQRFFYAEIKKTF